LNLPPRNPISYHRRLLNLRLPPTLSQYNAPMMASLGKEVLDEFVGEAARFDESFNARILVAKIVERENS
jgi:hypothetical protein